MEELDKLLESLKEAEQSAKKFESQLKVLPISLSYPPRNTKKTTNPTNLPPTSKKPSEDPPA
jgi:hypothetical protein